MFEVEDLAVASPATVSRCGMVYMEPGALGNEPLIASWLTTLPVTFKKKKNIIPNIQSYFPKYLNEMLKFVRKNCLEPVVTVDNNLVCSLLRILDCFFDEYVESETRRVTEEDIELLEQCTEQLFIFSLIWSVGVTTDGEGRSKFDRKLRTLIPPNIGIPDEGSVYDYMFEKKDKEWIEWTLTRKKYDVDSREPYTDIVVPTFDSIRMQFLTRLLLINMKQVLCPGPTGTGKSVNIAILLQNMLPEEYQYIPITFSA